MIGVIGLGYVGLVTASVLASHGYRVIGVDIDKRRVSLINKGKAPIYEPQLNKLIASAVSSDKLIASTSYESLRDTDIIFITVGTPSLSNGDINLFYIHSAAKKIAKVIASKVTEYPIIAVKSTVLPGTTRRVAKIIERYSGLRLGKNFGVVSNPEFLREGNAILDMLKPSRVVIGEVDREGADVLEEFWRAFYNLVNYKPPFLRVPAETAEMVKYASNSFLALKISFINLIARVCEKIPHCDVVEVAKGMGLDPRINPSFLGAGLGYGGSCFPKDVKALTSLMRRLCIDASLLEAVDKINETQPLHVVYRLEELLGGLEGKTIAILGVAFKPNTDDVRESRALRLAEFLLERGAKIKIHDPNPLALRNAENVLRGFKDIGDMEICKDLEKALEGAEAAVIATDWDYYRNIAPEMFLKLMKRPLVFDARRIYDPQAFREKGIELYAIGLGDEK